MAKKKTGLGADPLSWIQFSKEEISAQNNEKRETIVAGKKILEVPTTAIFPDPNQPRKEINERSQDIKDLADSIKRHGFINFITVKEGDKPGTYIIVAGERRFTAAQIAGLKQIPVMVVAEVKEPLDYALIQLAENLQRKDLTAFEEADYYVRLQKEFGLQQKEIGEKAGRSKGYISKMLKISHISPELRKETLEKNVPREVLFEMGSFPEDQQKVLWKKIGENPTIAAIEKAKKKLETVREKKEKQQELSKYDPDDVFEALKKAIKKDKNILFQFLTPKKMDKLMQEFGE